MNVEVVIACFIAGVAVYVFTFMGGGGDGGEE
jgi:hypothetical protein